MLQIQFNLDKDKYWIKSRDGDESIREVFDRHYSRIHYKDGRKPSKKFIGPGQNMVLRTWSCDAIFIWQRQINRRDGQVGVNCTVFRNEGNVLSSLLIEEAVQLAWERWPGERLFTFVNSGKIESRNPGYCFKKAGFSFCGRTKVHKLDILERLPS